MLSEPLTALFPDAVRVGRTLLRESWRCPPGMVGTLVREPVQAGGEDAAPAARRGLVTLGASLAPTSCGMDISEGEDVLVSHRLAPASLGPDQSSFVNLPLTLALLALPATLVTALFLERQL